MLRVTINFTIEAESKALESSRQSIVKILEATGVNLYYYSPYISIVENFIKKKSLSLSLFLYLSI